MFLVHRTLRDDRPKRIDDETSAHEPLSSLEAAKLAVDAVNAVLFGNRTHETLVSLPVANMLRAEAAPGRCGRNNDDLGAMHCRNHWQHGMPSVLAYEKCDP